MDGKIFQKSGKIQYTKEEFAKLVKYYVAIENIGNRVAIDAFVYIYSADTKSYMKATTYKVFIKPDKIETVFFIDETLHYKDEKEIFDYLKENYEVEISNIANYLKVPEKNCMFLFYKDIQDHVYLRVRQFSIDSNENAVHWGTQFYKLK